MRILRLLRCFYQKVEKVKFRWRFCDGKWPLDYLKIVSKKAIPVEEVSISACVRELCDSCFKRCETSHDVPLFIVP